MSLQRLDAFVRQLHHIVAVPAQAEVSDGWLLERFVRAGDEWAFAALMRRHGGMVLRVCRRILPDETDVEDAFQATFLLLVRRATSIQKRESVGSWLHGVAYRVAKRSQVESARRRIGERGGLRTAPTEPGYVAAWNELQAVLDEELQALPEKYRLPLVLCYMEGETCEQVAARLHWPIGTVRGRLARAREALRRRLTGRGMTLASAPFATALAAHTASAAAPAALAAATGQAAIHVLNGNLAAVPLRAATLADSLIRVWYIARLNVALVLSVGLLAAGGLTFIYSQNSGNLSPSEPIPFVSQLSIAKPSSPPIQPTADENGDPLPEGVSARLGTTRFRAGRTLYTFNFSPDGRWLVAPGEDGVICWDVVTGKEVRQLQGHQGRVFPIAFSKDGRWIVTGGADCTVRLWDLDLGNELACFKGHTAPIGGAVLSPDGKTLVSGSLDKTVRVWDVSTAQEIRRLDRPDNDTDASEQYPHSFLEDNRTVVSRGTKHVVSFWDVTTGQLVHRFNPELELADRVALSADGAFLAAGVRHRSNVRRWNVKTGDELPPLEGHEAEVRALHFSADGTTLITSSADRTLRFWDMAAGIEVRCIPVDYSQNEGLALSPDGSLVAAGQDGTIRLWSINSGNEVQPLKGHRSQVRMLGFTAGGRSVVSGGRDNTVCWWNPVSGKLDRCWRGENGKFMVPLTISADGRLVVCSGNSDGSIAIRDATSGVECGRLRGHKGSPYAIDVIFAAFAPDGHTLLTGGFDRSVRLWDVCRQHELRRYPGELPEISAVAFSPCGRFVAAGGRDGSVHIWEAESGKALHRCTGRKDVVRSLAFSSDSKRLATAHGRHFSAGDGVVALWNVESGTSSATLSGHAIRAHAVAFSPTGDLLATAGADCVVRLWHVDTGRELVTLKGHRGSVMALAFAPDGKLLASGSADTTVLIWQILDTLALKPSSQTRSSAED